MMLQRKRSLKTRHHKHQHHHQDTQKSREELESIIIPGLPNDIAIQCLIRVPRMYHLSMKSVSRAWNTLLRSEAFFSSRSASGHTDAWLLVIISDLLQKSPHFSFCVYDLATRSLLCRRSLLLDQQLQSFHPVDFRTAAVENQFIVVESRSSAFRKALENRTLIHDCISDTWRIARSPRFSRSSFSMAAIGQTVFIVGGFNCSGDFESTTEAYDLASDHWTSRSRIPLELDRVDSEVVFQGKLYVRGFRPDSHDSVMLVYDPRSDSWLEHLEMSTMDRGELVATSSGIFCLTSANRGMVYKFDESGWIPVSTRGFSFNAHLNRAFGMRDEIFILGGNLPESSASENGEVTFHGLFLGNTWQRAGSIVVA